MVKIALTYIVKDNTQADKFEKSLKSFARHFDGLFVVANGVSGRHDKIEKLTKKYNGKFLSISPKSHPHIYKQKEDGSYFFAHFGEARNLVFSMVPQVYDYISWADYDDVLLGGEQLRPIAENAKQRNIDMVFFTYAYKNKFDDFGKLVKVLVPHQRERLLANNGKLNWLKRVHETVLPKDERQQFSKENYTYGEDGTEIVWVHTEVDDINKDSLVRNTELLKLEAEEEGYKDPRTIFYLARAYFDIKTPEAFEVAENYLNMYIPMSGWNEEISQAYEFKGLIRTFFQDIDGTIDAYFNALKHNPTSHTANLKLADALASKGDIASAKHFLKAYENLPKLTSKSIITSPEEAEGLYYTTHFLIAHKEGRLDEAVTWAEKRAKLINDTILEDIKSIRDNERLAQALLNTSSYLIKRNKFDLLDQLLEEFPIEFQKDEFVKKITNSYPPKKWEDKTIVYFASFYGPHFEEWNGDNLKTGIGGSESAVIYLSELWVQMGYKVVVYCDTPIETVINGVEYKKYWKINWKDEFDTFIFWRTPQLLDIPVKAKRIFLDVHDVAFAEDYTSYRINKVDKVFFKSQAHREQVPQLPDSKAVVISNGITL